MCDSTPLHTLSSCCLTAQVMLASSFRLSRGQCGFGSAAFCIGTSIQVLFRILHGQTAMEGAVAEANVARGKGMCAAPSEAAAAI